MSDQDADPTDTWTLSDYERDHIGRILQGEGNSFNAHLLRLCAKADLFNLERLRKGFPSVVADYEAWLNGKPLEEP
jgi:hypothetical protein